MNPATGVLSVISVTAGAPHANAGKLLVDFLVSPEGQGMFRDADYIPVDPNVYSESLRIRKSACHEAIFGFVLVA